MSEKRKTYDKEFKLSAVKMILDGGMSISRISRDLGVNENSSVDSVSETSYITGRKHIWQISRMHFQEKEE